MDHETPSFIVVRLILDLCSCGEPSTPYYFPSLYSFYPLHFCHRWIPCHHQWILNVASGTLPSSSTPPLPHSLPYVVALKITIISIRERKGQNPLQLCWRFIVVASMTSFILHVPRMTSYWQQRQSPQ